MTTVVLVHGTTAGGWVWKDVAPSLRAAGHLVYTPTLTGLGERSHLAHRDVDLQTHILDIANVLAFEDLEQVVLVGHSYGGMVITGVANQAPERVQRLIYLDGLVPHHGEAAIDLVGPQVRQELERQVRTGGDGWLIPVQGGGNDRLTHNVPHPFKTWTQPLQLTVRTRRAQLADPTIRVSELAFAYVRCTADKQPGQFFASALETSWQRARSANWPIREIETVHQVSPDPTPKAIALLELL